MTNNRCYIYLAGDVLHAQHASTIQLGNLHAPARKLLVDPLALPAAARLRIERALYNIIDPLFHLHKHVRRREAASNGIGQVTSARSREAPCPRDR